VLQFNRFQESRHHDVIGTQICQSKLIHWWAWTQHFISIISW